ncbi:MAG: leucine-rich repeat protein [Aristaeellaceae bacterium]
MMAMLLLGITRVALAANPTITLDGVIYEPVSSTGTTYKVTGLTEDFTSDTLVLPSAITNPEDPTQVFSVVQIDSAALPAGVIRSLTVPASVTAFPYGAIKNGAVEEVYFEEGSALSVVEMNTFQGNSTLKKIYLPDSILYINRAAFNACSALTTVRLSARLSTMQIYAFSSCKALTELILPEGMKIIGQYAFMGCTALEEVTIPSTVTTVSGGAFSDCTALKQVTVRAGVGTIDGSAFSGCTSLSSVTLEEGLWRIQNKAFYNCPLESVDIPASVSVMFTDSFPSTCVLNVYLDSPAYTFAVENSLTYKLRPQFQYTVLDETAKTCCITGYISSDTVSTLNIPETIDGYTVTAIGDSAFADANFANDDITLITLPSTLTSIGKSAFAGCILLEEVALPEGLESIGQEAFSGDRTLMSITLPSTLTSIGSSVFSGCYGLHDVQFPENVIPLSNYMFANCSALTSVSLPAGITSLPTGLFSSCRNLASVQLPEGLTDIGEDAFYECKSLRAISLPESLETIGFRAFGSAGLSSIDFPEGLKTIGADSFYNCDSLKEIRLPGQLETLGEYAFANCDGLTGFELPDYMTSVPPGLLSGCKGLTRVVLPEGVATIGECAFSKATALTDVTLPSTLTTIYYQAFSGDTALTTITLPDSLSTISSYAFSNDTALTSVTLPDSLTSISDTAFDNCPNLILKVTQNSLGESFALTNGIDYRIIGYMPTALSAEDVDIIYGESAMIPITLTPAVDYTRVDGGALTFTSADPTIAYVDDQGLVKGRKPGTTRVYVKSVQDPFINATITVTVTDLTASKVFARAKTSRSGTTLNITYGAIGGTPPYTFRVSSTALSSDIVKTNVAATDGEVTLTAAGTVAVNKVQTVYVYVTVTDASGESDTATAKFQMTQKATQVGVGTPRQEVVLVTDENGNTYYRYVTVYDEYTTVITYPETHVSDWPGGNLISKITLSDEAIALVPGDTRTLTATTTPDGGDVVWISSDYNIADVSEDGTVIGISTGTAIISCCAVDGSGTQAQCTVNCVDSPVTAISITAGELDPDTFTQQLTAVLTPEDASFQQVTWSIFTGTVERATIDENGLVTWKEAGSALVTATATDGSGVQGSCVLYWDGIPVEKILPTRSADNPMQLAWRVEPENATNPNVTFAVDMPELLEVDETGHMTYLGDGTAHVRLTAADGSGVTATITIECFYHPEHTVVTITPSEATCTENGNSGGSYCEVCGDVFEKNTVTPALGHIEAITGEPVAATADADGHTIEVSCERCGECLVESVAISSSRIVRLPASLTTLDAEALTGINAQQIEVPEGALTIGSRAFAACDSLLLVILPDSLTSIAEDAFEGCGSVMILCGEGSTAQGFAEQHGIPCFIR